MTKPRAPSPRAVATARRVLEAFDVRHPRDVDVEAMAVHHRAYVVYGPAHTLRGAIVRAKKHSIVHVDERLRGTPRARFTIAHELGHHLMHDAVDHFAQCEDGDKKEQDWGIEREAKEFSSELLMPEAFARPLCAAERPTMEDVARLARTFDTSFETSAIRYVQLAAGACAVAYSVRGKIRWCPESATFPGRIYQRRTVHPSSLAHALHARGAGAGELGPREVPGEAWGGEGAFVEEAIAYGDAVLSWIVPA